MHHKLHIHQRMSSMMLLEAYFSKLEGCDPLTRFVKLHVTLVVSELHYAKVFSLIRILSEFMETADIPQSLSSSYLESIKETCEVSQEDLSTFVINALFAVMPKGVDDSADIDKWYTAYHEHVSSCLLHGWLAHS